MRVLPERGVPQEEHLRGNLNRLTDWDAARVFLEVVRCGSFRSAAERLGQSINLVRRRIDDFERQHADPREKRGLEVGPAVLPEPDR